MIRIHKIPFGQFFLLHSLCAYRTVRPFCSFVLRLLLLLLLIAMCVRVLFVCISINSYYTSFYWKQVISTQNTRNDEQLEQRVATNKEILRRKDTKSKRPEMRWSTRVATATVLVNRLCANAIPFVPLYHTVLHATRIPHIVLYRTA